MVALNNSNLNFDLLFNQVSSCSTYASSTNLIAHQTNQNQEMIEPNLGKIQVVSKIANQPNKKETSNLAKGTHSPHLCLIDL